MVVVFVENSKETRTFDSSFLFGSSCFKLKITVFLSWRITLRWTFRKWDMGVWTGSSWLRIGTGGGHM